MTGADDVPFALQVGYDQDELLGGRWWQASLPSAKPAGTQRAVAGRTSAPLQAEESRRTALKVMLGLGGFVVVAGLVSTKLGRSGTRTTAVDTASLDLQRRIGFATDAKNLDFTWPHQVEQTHEGTPLASIELHRLAMDLRPSRPIEQPDYVPTLFQCLQETGGTGFDRLLRLVHSPSMQAAFGRGEAIRELLDLAEERRRWALVVDLPGPDSIAFAAGLQPSAVAVFTFDNWPHPRGIVPSHLTLAAAVYYRERFLLPADNVERAVAFVLDRDRLANYTNQPTQFDNRYLARLPVAASLGQRGITQMLYVVPDGVPAEALADLVDRLAEYRKEGITVRMLGLGDLTLAPAPATSGNQPRGSNSGRYFWHGSPGYHYWFWNHYGWASRPGPVPPARPPTSSFGANWSPAAGGTARSLTGIGRTTETRTSTSGGSWGRSSGGFGG